MYSGAKYEKTYTNILTTSVKANFLFTVRATKSLKYIQGIGLASRWTQISPGNTQEFIFILFAKDFQGSQLCVRAACKSFYWPQPSFSSDLQTFGWKRMSSQSLEMSWEQAHALLLTLRPG